MSTLAEDVVPLEGKASSMQLSTNTIRNGNNVSKQISIPKNKYFWCAPLDDCIEWASGGGAVMDTGVLIFL
jgi:hypothetical protein